MSLKTFDILDGDKCLKLLNNRNKKVKNWIGNPCKWLNGMNIHFRICTGFCIFFLFFLFRLTFYPPKMVFINCVCVSMQWCSFVNKQQKKYYIYKTNNALNEDFSLRLFFCLRIQQLNKNSFTSKTNMVTQTHFRYPFLFCFNCIYILCVLLCKIIKIFNINTVVSKRAHKIKTLW